MMRSSCFGRFCTAAECEYFRPVGVGPLRLASGNLTAGRSTVSFRLENPVFLVHRPEQFLMGGNILRGTKKQIAAGTECVMKERDDAALQIRSQIDHDVSAGDQIQTRKRRGFCEKMDCEEKEIGDLPFFLKNFFFLAKKKLHQLL